MLNGVRSLRLASLRLGAATLVIGCATFVTVLPAQVASAANDVVSTCNNSGAGSLRAIVGAANSGDTITFSVSCPASSPITLTSTIDINTNLSIDGPGASVLVVSGNNVVEVFDIASGVTVTILGLAIEAGYANNGDGGGIYNQGTLTVTGSTLSDNTAGDGGGIYNAGGVTGGVGSLTVIDSTLSDNTATNGGGIDTLDGTVTITDSTLSDNEPGGIENDDGSLTVNNSTFSGNQGEYGGAISATGEVTITDSTFSSNSAEQGGGIYNAGSLGISDSTFSDNSAVHGGGIYSLQGELTVTSSTLSGNSATNKGGGIFNMNPRDPISLAATIVANSTGGDCAGPAKVPRGFTDDGYNLDDDSSCGFDSKTDHSDTPADLDPAGLENNGGPTQTIVLEARSAAVGAVDDATLCSTPDQRGVARPTPCDIGAVQLAMAITSVAHTTATVDSPFSFNVTTSGSPVPSMSEQGTLPDLIRFADNGNGTATISGKPKTAGTYHLTIKATFGKGSSKYVVNQSFTLTVDSG